MHAKFLNTKGLAKYIEDYSEAVSLELKKGIQINIEKLMHKTFDTPPIVIFGADICGRLLARHLKLQNIHIACFVDNNLNKCIDDLEGLPVIHTGNLTSFPLESVFLVASTYIHDIFHQLLDLGFFRVLPTSKILQELPQEKLNELPAIQGGIHGRGNFKQDFVPYVVSNMITSQEKYLSDDLVFIRSIDLIITEKCSLKCKDCANLMQYYEKPVDISTNELIEDVKDIVSVVDEINEIRIIGGEPLVNRNFATIISQILPIKKINKVCVYTNGTVVPSDKQMELLKSSKIFFFITNYGILSRQKEKLLAQLKKYNINHNLQDAYGWTECGTIGQRHRNTKDNEYIFTNCCAKNFLSMTDGNLYRCPFSANIVRLNGMPDELSQSDGYNFRGLNNASHQEKIDARIKLKHFLYEKKTLNACDFCAGRTYGDKEIKPGIQTKKPLVYETYAPSLNTKNEKKRVTVS